MAYENSLTMAEYIQSMQSLSGTKLSDCYHTQDSMLRFVLFEESRRIILVLDGDWQLWDDGKEICNSFQNSEESDHEYYEKLRNCALDIKKNISGISKISFDKSAERAEINFSNGWRLKVTKNKFGLLSYQNDETEEYLMYSVDEQTGVPRYYKSML